MTQQKAREALERMEENIRQHEKHPGTTDDDSKREVELTEIRTTKGELDEGDEASFRDALSPAALSNLESFQSNNVRILRFDVYHNWSSGVWNCCFVNFASYILTSDLCLSYSLTLLACYSLTLFFYSL